MTCEALIVKLNVKLLLSCLIFVYIYKDYNLLTISFGTLCFMHLVSERNLNIFFNKSSHGLFGSGQVDPQKMGRVTGHLVFTSGQKIEIGRAHV